MYVVLIHCIHTYMRAVCSTPFCTVCMDTFFCTLWMTGTSHIFSCGFVIILTCMPNKSKYMYCRLYSCMVVFVIPYLLYMYSVWSIKWTYTECSKSSLQFQFHMIWDLQNSPYIYMYMYITLYCTFFPLIDTCIPDTGLYVDNRVTVLDCLVILSAIVSTVLCGRSLTNSFRFQRRASKFFFEIYEYRLKWRDSLPLFNMWFVGVIASNVLAMLGSVMKIILTYWVGMCVCASACASVCVWVCTHGWVSGCGHWIDVCVYCTVHRVH